MAGAFEPRGVSVHLVHAHLRYQNGDEPVFELYRVLVSRQ